MRRSKSEGSLGRHSCTLYRLSHRMCRATARGSPSLIGSHPFQYRTGMGSYPFNRLPASSTQRRTVTCSGFDVGHVGGVWGFGLTIWQSTSLPMSGTPSFSCWMVSRSSVLRLLDSLSSVLRVSGWKGVGRLQNAYLDALCDPESRSDLSLLASRSMQAEYRTIACWAFTLRKL